MAAVGTLVITEDATTSMQMIKFAWTASAGGAVSGLATTRFYSGQAFELVTVPGAGLSAYTLQVLDGNGLDVLCKAGTARSTSLTEYILTGLGMVNNDQLTLVIAGAGNGGAATTYLFIR